MFVVVGVRRLPPPPSASAQLPPNHRPPPPSASVWGHRPQLVWRRPGPPPLTAALLIFLFNAGGGGGSSACNGGWGAIPKKNNKSLLNFSFYQLTISHQPLPLLYAPVKFSKYILNSHSSSSLLRLSYIKTLHLFLFSTLRLQARSFGRRSFARRSFARRGSFPSVVLYPIIYRGTFAFESQDGVEVSKIRCPCGKCQIHRFKKRFEVVGDLFKKGFMDNYKAQVMRT
ncbi:uncharacterized protein LOC110924214 [Helianthus annuus]|uniref:uncharacterized protein LOC110924214 n=1 Tax=Helianthus annuus TaxID=4232 RepID=UPI000B902BC2|nr:uncharacterized protein LOC110924214 [Helianthus annuus]